MMASLPPSWAVACLDEITLPIGTAGKKVKTKDALLDGRFPVIDQGASDCAGYLDDADAVVHASIDDPVVLFGDHTRHIKYITGDFIPGADGTKLMRARAGVVPKYLHYLLKSAELPDRGYGRHFQLLKGLGLAVAPSSEQLRIADKLDNVLARVDAVNARLARVAPLLKRFRQSVLAAATSGRLTADWRSNSKAEPRSTLGGEGGRTRRGVDQFVEVVSEVLSTWDAPASWLAGSVAKWLVHGVLIDVKDGNHGANHPLSAEFGNSGLPFLTAAQVFDSDIDYSLAPKITGEPLARLKVGFAKALDVVLTHKGTVGRVAVADRDCVLSPQTTYYRTRVDVLDPKYLCFYMQAYPFQEQLRQVKSQTTRDFVPITQQYSLGLLVPSIEEQTEIVRRVELLFGFADRLEARLQAAQTASSRLTPSLLAKAFRGELVPQDPNDEPASELLKRLAQSQPVGGAKKKGRAASPKV